MEPTSQHAARFSFFALGFLNFAWFSYFLAVAGFFFANIITVFGVLMLAGILAAARRWLSQETRLTQATVALVVIFSSTLLFFAEPTVFSGRDQGSISEAATELAHHHRFDFSSPVSETFSALHPDGKALNFPGFFYEKDGNLRTQFPLGYTTLLGAFDAIFGINGFRAANGILLSLSLLSLFFLVRVFSGERLATAAVLIGATSFLPTWFSKFTLTENLSLFLFLFLSLNLVLFLRDGRASAFIASFFSALLFAVTRIEGLWILPVALAILFLSRQGRIFVEPKKTIFRTVPLLFAGAVLFVNAFASMPFQVTMGKALLKDLSSVGAEALRENATTFLDLWSLFVPYGLALLFAAGFIGIAFLVFRKSWHALIPVLLAGPTLLYFIDPNITQDHPWMLRRFLFSLWPTLLFSAVVAFSMIPFRKKRLRIIIGSLAFLFMLAFQFPAFSRVFTFADNRGLLRTTEELSTLLKDRDLLLIDREASGDPFSIPAAPIRTLFGKNAAYFFDPKEYERLPKDQFDRILLLSPKQNIDFWQSMPVRLTPLSEVRFATKQLETLPLSESRLPKERSVEATSFLFLVEPNPSL